MFSTSKQKGIKNRKRQSDGIASRPSSLSQLGLLDVPNVSDLTLEKVYDDEDNLALEAELLALTGGDMKSAPKRGKKDMSSPEDLSKMIEECMRDNDDDVDLSDEEDPDLLAELKALGSCENSEDKSSVSVSGNQVADPPEAVLSPVRPAPAIVKPSPFMAGPSVISLLSERIQMYEEAEGNAIANGEASRAKRFNRGLQTMRQMLKAANAGKSIDESQIPPVVLLNSSRRSSMNDLSQPTTDHLQDPAKSDLLQSNAGEMLSPSPSSSTPSSNSLSQNDPKLHIPSLTQTIPDITNLAPTRVAPKPSPNKVVSSLPVPPPPPPSAIPTNNIPVSQSSPSALSHVLLLQREYKLAAVLAKKNGDNNAALQHLKVSKQLELLVVATKEGQAVDLKSLPPSPNIPAKEASVTTTENSKAEVETMSTDETSEPLPTPPAPLPASSVMEALEQRLAKYTEQRDKAKGEENTRKERMNQRIMKQYQDAIKLHKLGKPVDYDELPTPPGFPPIPVGKPAAASAPSPSVPGERRDTTGTKPTATSDTSSGVPPPKLNVRKAPQSRVERQLSILQKRQNQFKEAALEAKKRGEIEQAKEYLRNCKGLDQLLTATSSGLPVDMNTVPIPPQEQLGCENTSVDFEVIDKDDCILPPPSTSSDITLAYSKLEEDLISQIKMCAQTREHFKALGDVASSNRFEQLILHTKKDLDAVRVAFKRGDTPPRFHYENRSFTIIQCNTDLNDSDCEVNVMRGINFNVSNPKDVDTYIKIEFPYPTETPPQERSEVVKDTNNPEYNHKVVFSIDRKARALARIFKRQSIKCQVIAKGSWFHRDTVIGNVKVPLVPLETKCTLHESFDIVDERKKMVGGKLEVKVRVRNPIISKQLEKVTEKWIVIDGF